MMPNPAPTRGFNVTFLIILHLALALPLAYFLNIWADEASTLYATQHGFWTAFQTAAAEQKQAPLYFWVLSLWRKFDDSIFFARLFSVIASIVAIKLFSGLANRLFPVRSALLLTAFFALHPFLLWASLEIRVYSLVILLSIVLIRLFLAAFWDESPPAGNAIFRHPKVWFLFAVIIALYTNYYLGFLVAGLFASLIVSARWRQARLFALLMIVAAIAFVPMVIDLRTEFLAKTGGFREERSVIDGLRVLWSHFLTFVLPTEVLPSGEDQTIFSAMRLWIVRLAAAIFVLLTLLKRKHISERSLALGAVTATVIVFLLVAGSLLGTSYLALRHASVLFVPLMLFLSSVVVDISKGLKERTTRILSVAAGLLVLVSFSYALSALYPNMTKRGDWARVGEFIRQNESPGQPIIVFTAFEALALPYHYTGVNRILPDEKYFAFPPEASFGSPESLIRETEFVISEIPPEAEGLWVAVSEKCITTAACTPLDNYLKANYTIVIEKDLYLERLYLLKRKSQ